MLTGNACGAVLDCSLSEPLVVAGQQLWTPLQPHGDLDKCCPGRVTNLLLLKLLKPENKPSGSVSELSASKSSSEGKASSSILELSVA